MLRCVLGKKGSGKSLYLLWNIERFLKAGWPVATNIQLTDACPFKNNVLLLDGPDDRYPILKKTRDPRTGKPNGFRAFWQYMPKYWAIVIQEFDKYFDCNKFGEMDEECQQYFTQLRKLHHEIIIDTQCIENVYVRVRRQIDTFVVCENTRRSNRWMNTFFPVEFSRFVRSEFNFIKLRPQDHMSDGHFTYKEAQRLFPWYDTEQITGDIAQYYRPTPPTPPQETAHEAPRSITRNTGSSKNTVQTGRRPTTHRRTILRTMGKTIQILFCRIPFVRHLCRRRILALPQIHHHHRPADHDTDPAPRSTPNSTSPADDTPTDDTTHSTV